MSSAATHHKSGIGRKEITRASSDFINRVKGQDAKDRTLSKALGKSKYQFAVKEKHVRKLLLRTWREGSIGSFYRDIARLNISSDPVLAYKSLIILHKLMREGPPAALADAFSQRDFLERLVSTWESRFREGYAQLTISYGKFLKQKVNFHQVFQHFNAQFSLEEYLSHGGGTLSPHKANECVVQLLSLQETIMDIGQKVYSTPAKKISEAMVSVFVELIPESFGIYQITVYLLKQLTSNNNPQVGYAVQQFNEHYPALRSLFNDTANVQYVISMIQVPVLPPNPPSFDYVPPAQNNSPEYYSSSSSSSSDSDDDRFQQQQQQPPSQPTFTQPIQPVFTQPIQPAQPVQPIFTSQPMPSPRTQSSVFTDLNQAPAPVPQSWVSFSNTPQFVSSSASQQPSTAQQMAAPNTAEQLSFQKLSAKFLARAEKKPQQASNTPAPTPQQTPAPQPAATKQNAAKPKITLEELAKRYMALQNLFKKERQKTIALQQALDKSRAEADHWKKEAKRLSESNIKTNDKVSALSEQQEQLQAQIMRLERERDASERLNAMNLLDAAKGKLNTSIQALLSTVSGISADKPEDLISLGEQLSSALVSLLSAKTPQERAMAIQQITSLTDALLNKVRTISEKIDDPETKQKLIDSARTAANAISKLLSTIQATPNDKMALTNAGKSVSSALKEISQLAKNIIDEQENKAREAEQNNKQVEDQFADQATKELLQAVQVIERAAKTLHATKKAAKPKLSSVELAISDAIVDAALAIASATSNLVRRATVVQKENVAEGRAKGQGVTEAWYKKNQKWSQGLISAAKAVAEGTSMLVHAANETANGRVQEEALIASSMSVSASTAQLIAASRVRSDPNSAAQRHLEVAAKSVSTATQKLVDAAKSCTDDSSASSSAAPVQFQSTVLRLKAQQEAQMKILELQKSLEQAQKHLMAINKSDYGEQS